MANHVLAALVAGTYDRRFWRYWPRGRLRAKLPAFRAALAGRFRTEHHRLLVAQILAHIDDPDDRSGC